MNDTPKYKIVIYKGNIQQEKFFTDENFIDIVNVIEKNLAVFPSIARFKAYSEDDSSLEALNES